MKRALLSFEDLTRTHDEGQTCGEWTETGQFYVQGPPDRETTLLRILEGF